MALTAAVTGATGFIGTILVKRLLKGGLRVKALVRPCSLQRCWQHPALEWITGDIEDSGSLELLVKGSDLVVHSAGLVKGLGAEDFHRINTLGVESLSGICMRQPVPPRFLLISSLAARHPELSHYALSKKRGEEKLRAFDPLQLSWTIFRPPAVYGPGDREMRFLFKCMEYGVVPCLAKETNRFSLLHVHDLAEAVMCWVGSPPRVHGRTYELHDGFSKGYCWDDVTRIVQRALDKRPVKVRIPEGLLLAVASFNAKLARLRGKACMLSPGKARELAHPDWVCDNTEIFQDTGWKPAILLEDALKQGLI